LAALAQPRQVLAYLNAGRRGRRGAKLATHADGRVGLQIEALVLGQAARQEDVDAGAGTATARSCRCGAQRLHVVHAEAEQADSAGLDGGAPRDARMMQLAHRDAPVGVAYVTCWIGNL